ncbi:hypothetical protein KR018_004986 [Drosophila ironensis]|nr:hypothetical protein KR018_004986 [Drosophila ironensis]
MPTEEEIAKEEPQKDAQKETQNLSLSGEESSADTEDSPSLTMDIDIPSVEDGSKIASDSEKEEPQETTVKQLKASVEAAAPIKLNGAHQPAKAEEPEKPKKPEEEHKEVPAQHEEPGQEPVLSVITNRNAEAAPVNRPDPPPVLNMRMTRSRCTSGSSTVSSASQPQLVIDHSESEHNTRSRARKAAQKRRRNKTSSASLSEKRAKLEGSDSPPASTSSSSLLLQRLQAAPPPAETAMDTSQPLNCAKCGLEFPFESFQLLNEHQAQCSGARKAESNDNTPSTSATKLERYYRCAQCSTVHQSWNFFLHLRDVHQRYICLYCSHVYLTVEKLSLHLENKHDIDQSHFTNKEQWLGQQQKEDRVRYLVCCTCQATFGQGGAYDEHVCAENVQQCALCEQRGDHAAGCKNGKRKLGKRRRKARKLGEQPATDAAAQPLQEQTAAPSVLSPEQLPVPPLPAPLPLQALPDPLPLPLPPQLQPQTQAEMETLPPAPEPVEEPPASSTPKLIVPKIMLRVPKQYQKSVDAALSSTESEEEEPETQAAEAEAEEEPQPVASQAAPAEEQVLPPIEAPGHKFKSVLEELERTKLDILRTKASIERKLARANLEDPSDDEDDPQDEPLPGQPPRRPEEQRRWSLTPPASPHNLPEQAPAMRPIITEFQAQAQAQADAVRRNSLGSDCMDMDDSLNVPEAGQAYSQQHGPNGPLEQQAPSQLLQQQGQGVPEAASEPPPPSDGILVAGPETYTVDLQLDRPLDRFPMVELVRLCLRAVYSNCLYCNHARRIAVNAKQLVLHLIGQHRFTATVDSITAEELHAETIVARLKSFLPLLEEEYLNSASYCTVGEGQYRETFNERIYECFTCRFVTSTHKELYTHNRRLHIKSNIMCVMCQTNFYSYSEILCHICPGRQAASVYDLKFRCCLCEMAPLPSAFRLMVHLRKQHQACDICLEDCQNQTKLSAHVWKHKLLHLCYRCGIAYRNKQDISKHLFWKHGTESASCKRCLQKRWRHVYHFCVPPVQFPCEECGFNFSKAIYLEVHQRMHSGDFRYACAEEGCEEKFVSRKLLLKHASTHVIKELPVEAIEAPKVDPSEREQEIKKESDDAAVTPMEVDKEEKLAKKDEGSDKEKKEPADTKDVKVSKDHTGKSDSRKKRKKSKRNKESLADLNLIAPNLSESDSSDDSDSDAARSSHKEPLVLPMRPSVDDLDMPKVMLSPSSESDADEPGSKPKVEAKSRAESLEPEKKEVEEALAESKEEPEPVEQVDVSIWQNLLQNQANNVDEQALKQEEAEANEKAAKLALQPPAKVHVAWSDHDYCKLHRTPAPSPVKQKPSTPKSAKKARDGASSDSDSSSSSSSSGSESSSCTCGTNCSCSSSNSSSSSDDSDDSDSSNAAGTPQKRVRKKSLKMKKGSEPPVKEQPNDADEDHITPEQAKATAVNAAMIAAAPPSPKRPMYNESDFDTNVSDTDEEFYDSHPQKLANELLTQKREALLAEHAPLANPSNNYDIVENSRPSTPSLPEEAAAFANKRERDRGRNKKKKRERKSTCKSGKMPLPVLAGTPMPVAMPPMPLPLPLPLALPLDTPVPGIAAALPETPLYPITPLTHRHLQPSLTRMSEGSSSDADGQLKRSKRQRRPNKFYGYTSDDENMSSILAPPLQVGMQLIKPQPPPLLTWAKEDLPTPPKQRNRNNNNHHHHGQSNGGSSLVGSGSGSRKRSSSKRSLLGAGGSSRSAKRHKSDRTEHLPPIPTLKIRPSLLPSTMPLTDSSDSGSEDEDVEVNVTTVADSPLQVATPAPPVLLPPPPPPVVPPVPTATAFNQPIPPALLPNPSFQVLQYFKANNIRYPIRPPAGARLAREGESVYCYCRCPYDEVSEMIACDGENCLIEWFHFECVGIMVAPQGKWFCAECRAKYSEGASSYTGVLKA